MSANQDIGLQRNTIDKYYEKLPDKAKETESDKTWRLF